jgi:hypothetical protein
MATHLSPSSPLPQRTTPTEYRFDRLRIVIGMLAPVVAALVLALR